MVVECLDMFSSFFVTDDGGATMVTRGSEQLAGLFVMCFLRAFPYLLSMEPASTIIRDFCFSMSAIHHLVAHLRGKQLPDWGDYTPPTDELSTRLVGLLHTAFFVSRSAPFHFGYTVLDTNNMTSNENARLEQLFALIIREHETFASKDPRVGVSKFKPTMVFLQYVARREENGTDKSSNTSFRVAGFSPPLPNFTLDLRTGCSTPGSSTSNSTEAHSFGRGPI
ncbi:hypothetical protein BDM02DRAFT_3187373 [Thelephora ganbajun]|uniref:Uncharacterized protein n=1 Tax=Thelephora ganbajun TaxID=370292 RepID=A0ACB6ZF63_THEGA|nr:hypothetical protein BDM02DRAFT_3187373 [Thelephora ganbajun]